MNITDYEVIYNSFLSKVRDYDFAKYLDDDLDELLLGYLNVACTRFNSCEKDLSLRDDELKMFEVLLNDEEVEILANHMVCCWLESKVNDLDLLKNTLNTTDFSFFSPANLLSTMKERYKEAKLDARKLTNEYSFRKKDLKSLLKK